MTCCVKFFNVIGLYKAKLWDFDGSVIWRYLIFFDPSINFGREYKIHIRREDAKGFPTMCHMCHCDHLTEFHFSLEVYRKNISE